MHAIIVILATDLAVAQWFYNPHRWQAIIPVGIIVAEIVVLVIEGVKART